MRNSILASVLSLALVAVLGVSAYSQLAGAQGSEQKEFRPALGWNWSLEMEGGYSFLLKVQTQIALGRQLEAQTEQFLGTIAKEITAAQGGTGSSSSDLVFHYELASDKDQLWTLVTVSGSVADGKYWKEALEKALSDRYPGLTLQEDPYSPKSGEIQWKLAWSESVRRIAEDRLVQETVEKLKNRLAGFGFSAATVQPVGRRTFQVDLRANVPGFLDQVSRLRGMLTRPAQLELRPAFEKGLTIEKIAEWVQSVEPQLQSAWDDPSFDIRKISREINQALQNTLPEGAEIAFERIPEPERSRFKKGWIPHLVLKQSLVEGDEFTEVQIVRDADGRPSVSFRVNEIAGEKLESFTKENIGKRLAILLDGVVYSAPRIRDAITQGEGKIQLGFGSDASLLSEARDLSLILQAGALPAPVQIVREKRVEQGLVTQYAGLVAWGLLLTGLIFLVWNGRRTEWAWSGMAAGALAVGWSLWWWVIAWTQLEVGFLAVSALLVGVWCGLDWMQNSFSSARRERFLETDERTVWRSVFQRLLRTVTQVSVFFIFVGLVLFLFGGNSLQSFCVHWLLALVFGMWVPVVLFLAGLRWRARASAPLKEPTPYLRWLLDLFWQRKRALWLVLGGVAVTGAVGWYLAGVHLGPEFTGGFRIRGQGVTAEVDKPEFRQFLKDARFGSMELWFGKDRGGVKDFEIRSLVKARAEVLEGAVLDLYQGLQNTSGIRVKAFDWLDSDFSRKWGFKETFLSLILCLGVLFGISVTSGWRAPLWVVGALGVEALTVAGMVSIGSEPWDSSSLVAVVALLAFSLYQKLVWMDPMRMIRIRNASPYEKWSVLWLEEGERIVAGLWLSVCVAFAFFGLGAGGDLGAFTSVAWGLLVTVLSTVASVGLGYLVVHKTEE